MTRLRSGLWLVGLGGMLGTLARYAVEQAFPRSGSDWPTGTFAVNVAGAFALGALLGVLQRHGDDSGRRRAVRLAAGSGFLGAFTTFSSLAVEADLLARSDAYAEAALYAGLSVVTGLVATVAGLRLGAPTLAGALRTVLAMPEDPDTDTSAVIDTDTDTEADRPGREWSSPPGGRPPAPRVGR